VLSAIACLCWTGPSPLVARQTDSTESPDAPKEHTVKAVFLYGFGRYVEWPKTAFATSKSPFVIGILGEDWFNSALDEIAKKRTIQDRKIVIKRFATLEAYVAYKARCHILFVSRSLTAEQQAAVIAKTAGKPVFVVGETPGFAEHGGTANFFADGDRISFEINTDTVRQSQLRVDARLLSLAKRVTTLPATAGNSANSANVSHPRVGQGPG
jgi:hypothetical protein